MKLAVIGSRTFIDYELLKQELQKYDIIDELVSGGARGADSLAERYSKEFDIPIKIFYADWKRYGRSAGPRRNKFIIDYCDEVIAFWDGESKGNKNSIEIAKNQDKRLRIITPKGFM